MEFLLVWAVFLLILVLIWLVGLRKKNEEQKEQIDDFVRNNTYWNDEYKKSKEKNREQANTIRLLNCSLDESYIAINAV